MAQCILAVRLSEAGRSTSEGRKYLFRGEEWRGHGHRHSLLVSGARACHGYQLHYFDGSSLEREHTIPVSGGRAGMLIMCDGEAGMFIMYNGVP